MKRLLFVGPGRCGKDTALEWATAHTPLKAAGTFSWYLAPYVASRLGVSVQEAYADRHNNRKLWYDTGNELRDRYGADFLFRLASKDGQLTGGLRSREELLAVRPQVDLVVWVERVPTPPTDPTLEFTAADCDAVILNDTLEAYFYRLTRLFRSLGVSVT